MGRPEIDGIFALNRDVPSPSPVLRLLPILVSGRSLLVRHSFLHWWILIPRNGKVLDIGGRLGALGEHIATCRWGSWVRGGWASGCVKGAKSRGGESPCFAGHHSFCEKRGPEWDDMGQWSRTLIRAPIPPRQLAFDGQHPLLPRRRCPWRLCRLYLPLSPSFPSSKKLPTQVRQIPRG